MGRGIHKTHAIPPTSASVDPIGLLALMMPCNGSNPKPVSGAQWLTVHRPARGWFSLLKAGQALSHGPPSLKRLAERYSSRSARLQHIQCCFAQVMLHSIIQNEGGVNGIFGMIRAIVASISAQSGADATQWVAAVSFWRRIPKTPANGIIIMSCVI
jgi:hypothetical protein